MKNRDLPIRLFQTREIDQLRTEGGGSKELPKWAMIPDDDITNRKDNLIAIVDEISEELSTKIKNDNYIPSVLTLTLEPHAKSKGSRAQISSMFKQQKKNPVIGFDNDNNLLVKVIDGQGAAEIKKRIKDNPETYKLAFASILKSEKYNVDVTSIPESFDSLKVKLLDFVEYDVDELNARHFLSNCKDAGIEVERLEQYKTSKIYRINTADKKVLDFVASLDGIMSINSFSTVIMDEPVDLDSKEIEIPTPEERDYPVVGLLDSGIDKSSPIYDWVIDEYSTISENEIDTSHGTGVASILIMGDYLESKDYTGHVGVKIFNGIVIPKKEIDISIDELLLNIRTVVSKNGDIKIWNLSLGTFEEIHDSKFSDFAIELDHLQDEFDITIVTTTGNCERYLINKPRSKISLSADTLRGIVVGSVAHTKDTYDFYDENYPSPFTRVGPAPGDIIKPDVMQYGGNAGLHVSSSYASGVNVISSTGLSQKIGTSFSAPRVSNLIGALNHVLDVEYNTNLIKALAIHSAQFPSNVNLPENDKHNLMGYGITSNIDDILYSTVDEVTLMLTDTLNKGNFINIMDFPYPKSLIEEGHFYGQIFITLVTNTVLDEKQGAEYCQSCIDISFGTYDSKTQRDTTKSTVINPIKADGSQNFLLNENYSSRKKTSNTDFQSNRVIQNLAKKYTPVKKWCIDLEDFTDGKRINHLSSDKLWFLKIEGRYKQFAEEMSAITRSQLSQDFSLIITIKDKKERGITNTEVIQGLDANQFINQDLKLRTDVRLELQG